MLSFQPLSVGWEANNLNYSAGLMELSYDHSGRPHDAQEFSYAWGHAGDTYGFASTQAYVPRAQAAFSVASNIDKSTASSHMGCWALEVAAEVFTGAPGGFNCGYITFGDDVQAAIIV